MSGDIYAVNSFVMRPSSVGGGRILRRTLSVCLSVCLSVRPVRGSSFVVFVFVYFFYSRTVLRANIQNRKTSIFAYRPASRMYFSARTEGRISYGTAISAAQTCLNSIVVHSFFAIGTTVESAQNAFELKENLSCTANKNFPQKNHIFTI